MSASIFEGTDLVADLAEETIGASGQVDAPSETVQLNLETIDSTGELAETASPHTVLDDAPISAPSGEGITNEVPEGTAEVAPTTLTANDAASLTAALAAAQDGDVIRLAGGEYGDFNLEDYGTSVTLVSDPADSAVFSTVQFENVSGLTFDGVTFDYTFTEGDAEWYRPFRFADCSDITIQNSLVDGDTAFGRDDEKDGYGTGTGLRFEYCENIQILDNEVRGFRDNIQLNTIENIVVSGNEIHHMREDAIEFGTLTNALFENNHLHDTAGYPLPEGAAAGSGDHPDFFQINGGGEISPSSNLVFRGNLMDQGSGTGSQGIFLTNHDDVPWQNITIENNTLINSYGNGIMVGLTDGLIVSNNAVLHAFWDLEDSYTPAIRLDTDSTNAVVTGNISGTAAVLSLPESWETANNFVVQSTDPQADNYYTDHFIGISGDLGGHVEKFMLAPSSEISAVGAGTSHNYLSDTLETGAPIARILVAPSGDSDSFLFDASMSTLPELAVGNTAEPDAETAEGLINFSSDSGDISTADGTVLVDQDAGTIDLRGLTSSLMIDRSEVDAMVDAPQFQIDLTLQNDPGAEGGIGGEIMRLDRAFKVNVTDDGGIVFRLKTTDGDWNYLSTKGAGLTDGAVHDVSLRYFADDKIQIVVDGNVLAETDIDGSMVEGISSVLTIGGQYGATAYGGMVDSLVVALDEPALVENEPQDVLVGGTDIGGPGDGISAPEVDGDEDGYDFVWTFEDGTQMTGAQIEYNFDVAGYHDVALTVIGSDGSTDTSVSTVSVAGTSLLNFDSQTGDFCDMSYGETNVLVDLAPGAIDLRGLDDIILIQRTDIQSVIDSEEFRIDMVLSLDPAEDAPFGGEVMRLDRAFQVNVTNSGEVDFRLKTSDGTWHRLITDGANLDDGISHDLSLRFDADNMIQVVVDDEVLSEANVVGPMDPGIGSVMVIGGQYGATAFGGLLEDLGIELEFAEMESSDIFDTATGMLTADDGWALIA